MLSSLTGTFRGKVKLTCHRYSVKRNDFVLTPSVRILGIVDKNMGKPSSLIKVPVPLTDPTSKHLLKDYAMYEFQYSDWTFGSIGEYQLETFALAPYSVVPGSENACISVECDTHSDDGLHDVLIFPERVWLRNLTRDDISVVMQFALRPETTLDDVAPLLARDSSSMDHLNILVHEVSNETNVANWFMSAAEKLDMDICIFSATGATSSSQVLLLPPYDPDDSNSHSNELADRLEYVVSERAAFDILCHFKNSTCT